MQRPPPSKRWGGKKATLVKGKRKHEHRSACREGKYLFHLLQHPILATHLARQVSSLPTTRPATSMWDLEAPPIRADLLLLAIRSPNLFGSKGRLRLAGTEGDKSGDFREIF
ncbi:unnamed protein product [Musa hybrid cultivar]